MCPFILLLQFSLWYLKYWIIFFLLFSRHFQQGKISLCSKKSNSTYLTFFLKKKRKTYSYFFLLYIGEHVFCEMYIFEMCGRRRRGVAAMAARGEADRICKDTAARGINSTHSVTPNRGFISHALLRLPIVSLFELKFSTRSWFA